MLRRVTTWRADRIEAPGRTLVERVERSRRYRVRPYGIRILAGMFVLREKVIKPVLSGVGKKRVGRPPKHVHPID